MKILTLKRAIKLKVFFVFFMALTFIMLRPLAVFAQSPLTTQFPQYEIEVDHCYITGTHQIGAMPSFNGSGGFYSQTGQINSFSGALASAKINLVQDQTHLLVKQALSFDFEAHKDFDIDDPFESAMQINRAVFVYGSKALKPEDYKNYQILLAQLPPAYDHLRTYKQIQNWDRYGGYSGRMAEIEIAKLNWERALAHQNNETIDSYTEKTNKIDNDLQKSEKSGAIDTGRRYLIQNRLDHVKGLYLRSSDVDAAVALLLDVSRSYESECDRELKAYALLSAARTLLEDADINQAQMSVEALWFFNAKAQRLIYLIDLLPNLSLYNSRDLLKNLLEIRLLYHSLLLRNGQKIGGLKHNITYSFHNHSCALVYFMKVGERAGIELALPEGVVIDPAHTKKCYTLPF